MCIWHHCLHLIDELSACRYPDVHCLIQLRNLTFHLHVSALRYHFVQPQLGLPYFYLLALPLSHQYIYSVLVDCSHPPLYPDNLVQDSNLELSFS